MWKSLTILEFIEKSNKVHNNFYDYSKFIYTGDKGKSVIICPIHGEFIQSSGSHIQKKGCTKCSVIKRAKKNTLPLEEFIKKSNIIHFNKYCYDKFTYSKGNQKSIIICKIHGEYSQTGESHMQGKGCFKCAIDAKTRSIETFLKEAKNIHGNKYSYPNLNYKSNRDKILIHCNTCEIDFKQKIHVHITLKCGCKQCWIDKLRKESSTFKYSIWEKKGENSKNFDSFKVYIIKCWNNTETFYKVGKTFNKICNRFRKKDMPYNYEILKIIEGNAKETSKLEHKIQRENKEFKYFPKIKFKGQYECFSKIEN